MIYIVQGIIHGYPDDGTAYSQHDDADTALEAGDDAQCKEGAGGNGNENPEHILHALVTQPQDQGDQDGGDGQGQQGVFLDTAGIMDGYFGSAGGADAQGGILPCRLFLYLLQGLQQLCIPTAFTAAVGGIE